jgi:hypothetical protein
VSRWPLPLPLPWAAGAPATVRVTAGGGHDSRGRCLVDGAAVAAGPLVAAVGPGSGELGQHRCPDAADQQRVPVGQLAEHRRVADVVPSEVLLPLLPEGGLPAQFAGRFEQGGVGDAGQEDLAAGGVADDLRALFAPAFAELGGPWPTMGELDAGRWVGHEVGDVDRRDVGDLVGAINGGESGRKPGIRLAVLRCSGPSLRKHAIWRDRRPHFGPRRSGARCRGRHVSSMSKALPCCGSTAAARAGLPRERGALLCSSRMVEMVRRPGTGAGPARWPAGSARPGSGTASASSAVPISHRPTGRISPDRVGGHQRGGRTPTPAGPRSPPAQCADRDRPVGRPARRARPLSHSRTTGDQAKVEGRSEALRVEQWACAGRGCRWSARRCRF